MAYRTTVPSALALLVGIASLVAVLLAVFPSELEAKFMTLFVMFFSRQTALLLIGIALLLLVVVVQWWQILNLKRVEKIPLSEVERLHPKLPASLEIAMTGILSTALFIFFLQLATVAHSVLFTASVAFSTAETNNTIDLIISDFDADGDVDLIAGNNKLLSEQHDVYRNSGTGALTRVQGIDAATNFVAFDGGDLDGDNNTDFFQVTRLDVSVYRGTGSGTFVAGSAIELADIYALPSKFTDIALGDMDNDGDLDAVTASIGVPQSHSLFLNNGKAVFRQMPMRLASASAVTLFDANNDDYLDAAIINTSGSLTVYRNAGTGTLVQVFTIRRTLHPILAPGDIDDDGDIDLVTANSSQQLVVWKSGGTGSVTPMTGVATSIGAIKAIALGDIDNDGDLDAIVGGNVSGADGGSQIFINNGSGVFTGSELSMPATSDNTNAIAIGDVDNDADLDWILGNGGTQANRVIKTNQSTFDDNTTPSASSSLNASIVSPSAFTGSTIASVSGTGTVAWVKAENAGKSDNLYASGSLTSLQATRYLTATGFGIEVLSGTSIVGITVTVERNASFGNSVYDDAIRLIKGGSIVGDNKATATAWSTTDETATYGGTTDLWGTTWTAEQVSSDGFGVAISAQNFSGSAVTASVDSITATIYTNKATVRLTWGSGSDTETATRMLQYQPRVGTGSTGHNVISGRSVGNEYTARVMGNANVRTYLLKGLACGLTYYWAVRTHDHQHALSSESSTSSFAVNSACEASEIALSSSASTQGGGRLPNPGLPGLLDPLVEINENDDEGIPDKYVGITIRAFVDANGDGVKQDSERGISGLRAHIEGKTTEGSTLDQDIDLEKQGERFIAVLPSDSAGYSVTIDPASKALRGFRPTVVPSPILVEADSSRSVDFGYIPEKLLGTHQPCLVVKPDVADKNESDVRAFFDQLHDNYGNEILRGIDLDAKLMTTDTFMTLLLRSFCVPTLTKDQILAKNVPAFADLPLADVPFDQTRATFYSLVAAGVTAAGKSSFALSVADPSAPISRSQAVRALHQAIAIAVVDPISASIELPIDLTEDGDLSDAFGTLASIGILPQYYWPIFGPERGLTTFEALTLIARGSLISGRVSLLATSTSTATSTDVPTFLANLPFTLKPIEYLESDDERSLRYSDVRPGNSFFGHLEDIAKYRIPNADGDPLYLITGSPEKGLLEFGVTFASGIRANVDAAATYADVLRSLLVLIGRPWETKEAMQSGSFSIHQGSGNQFPQARIFGLIPGPGHDPPDALVFRVGWEFERPQVFGNLSLSSYASALLLGDARVPDAPMKLDEFATISASAILNIAATQGVIAVAEAPNYVEPVRLAILRDLVGQAGTSLASSRSLHATRGNLFYVLSVITGAKRTVNATELDAIRPTDAEIWLANLLAN